MLKDQPCEKKKKIGQVTYYTGNYGSTLQCYATQKLLGAHDFDVSLLEVRNPFVTKACKALLRRAKLVRKIICYPKHAGEIKRLYQNASNAARCMELMPESTEKMVSFIDQYVKKETYSSKQLKRAAWGSEFGAFISGSDQIWSAAWPLPDETFYLRFAPKRKRVAFAPSFGGTRLSAYNKEILKYISAYSLLSVREPSGRNIVRDATVRECAVLNDPVLQLERKYWDELADKSQLTVEEPYICLFFIDQPSTAAMELIERVKEQYHIKMINFGYRREFGCESIAGGPEDFLKLLKNARLVLTDSFHAMSFSIIFHSEFYAVKRNYQHRSDQSSRITELLAECGLEDRFLTDERIDNTATSDFSQADAFLKTVQDRSDAYIRSIISLIKENVQDDM